MFSVAHFSHHLSTGVLVPLLPLLREDLRFNYFQAGVLVAAFSLSYGFGQLPTGVLADRFGARILIVAGLIGTAVTAAIVGLTHTYWQMIPCFIALGLLGATYHAPASAFLSQVVPLDSRGQSLGTHTIGGGASFLITPVLAVAIASWAGGWRWAFVLLSVPALLMAPLMWALTRGIDLQEQAIRDGDCGPVAAGSNPGHRRNTPAPTVSWREILAAVGVLALLTVVLQVVVSSVHSYMPLYLVDRHSISPEYAGIVVGLVAGGGVLGAPVGGAISDRMGRKWVILLSLALAGPMLFVALQVPATVWLPVSLAVYGVTISARMPAMESLIADVVQPGKRATVLGIYYLAGQETAGIITPLVGRLIDLHGPDLVFLGLPAGLTIVALVALAFRRRI